jgi:hypothetical protein
MAKNDIPIDVVPDELLKRTKNIVGAVAEYRKENPVYMPFAPGAKTGERRMFDEDVLRDRRNFEEDVFRDRRNFAEGVRQFNAKLAADAVGGGGGGGDYDFKDYSENERSAERSNTVLRYLQARMKAYIGKSDVPFQRAIDDTVAYFSLSPGSAYSGEEILDAIMRQAGELSKTDPKIREAMGAGGNYFDTMGGRKNRWFYDLYMDKDRYTPPLTIDEHGNFVPAGTNIIFPNRDRTP